MKQVSATVISNTELFGCSGVRYCLICVEAPDIAAIARPGQFVMVWCGEDVTLRRPLSIHRVVDSNQLCLLYQVAGRGTYWLSHRQKGETLDLLGPLGNGFSIEPSSQNLLLVAGGIGIAPLVFLAQWAIDQGKAVKLLLGARTSEGLYPKNLLPGGVESVLLTEDGSAGRRGMVTGILPEFTTWADIMYACGPKAMYETVGEQKRRREIGKPVQVSLEVRMGCGLGACYGCSIRTRHGMKRVCQDGPVFDLEEIIWQEVKV